MQNQKAKKYFLGLDVGTSSVGAAITTLDYLIYNFNGRNVMSTRKFEEAATAKKRRILRDARRLLGREKFRVDLLQKIFEDEIMKIDEGFYHRLKESRYTPDDKRDIYGNPAKTADSIFADPDYTDKDYYENFPTVYHLIRYLKRTKDTPDIRLVYLAFAFMMRHRGHFLFAGELKAIRKLNVPFNKLLDELECMDDFNLTIGKEEIEKIGKVLKDTSLTKSAKKKELIKLLGAKTNCEKAVITLITGGDVKLSKLFGDKEMDAFAKNSVCFTESNYEKNEDEIKDELKEQFAVIDQAKAVYNWSILVNILNGHSCISDAMIDIYEKHKHDKKYLKKLIRNNLGQNTYKHVFMESEKGLHNYCAYVGNADFDKRAYKCNIEEFYEFLKKEVISKINNKEKTKYIEEEIEKGTFLPKQRSRNNSALPHQVYLEEMNAIIDNLSDRIQLLKDNADDIRTIFSFCIPYFVGPTSGVVRDGESTSWAVKKIDEKVTPLNFYDVIDPQQCQEHFMRRMTSKCTYLFNEDVLPKNSLLYSRFVVLNELNNVSVNGKPISVELKQEIYNDLFMKYRKVTVKLLTKYLEGKGYQDADITGIDGDFKNSLTAYHDFKKIGGGFTEEEMEDIILNVTLFGQNKVTLRERLIDRKYKDIDKLCALSYTGWGNLSERFLTGIMAPNPETGEALNIITALWETNDNLSQLLGEKYRFIELLEEENAKYIPDEITYDYIDDLHVPAPVKRQIWQAIKVVKECMKITDGNITKIFIEMARGKTNDGPKESRKAMLIRKFKEGELDKSSDHERDWVSEIMALDINIFRSDKYYLYFIQQGRCAYSGEEIQFSDLATGKYDIEHIHPQSKVMDDSLDNKVLVKKELNAAKSDNYPIDPEIQKRMAPFWKSLVENKFISKEKYNRLVRTTPLSAEELGGFIARQLVETRQSTKLLGTILQQMFPDTEIVYVKAAAVTHFRREFGFLKVRDMNDLHHAKDAYLATVVGNTYDVKFTKNPINFIKDNPGRSYNIEKLFKKDIVERNGVTAWVPGEDGTIETVKEVMGRNDILVTEMVHENHGELFDQKILKKGEGQMPIKGSDERLQDIDKYGAYKNVMGAYFMLVESEIKKGEFKRSIEFMPIYMSEKCKTDKEKVKYLQSRKVDPLKNPRIIISEIKPGTLFIIDGFPMRIMSRSNTQITYKGDVQLILQGKEEKTLKNVMKFVTGRKVNKDITLPKGLKEEDLINLYDVFLDKLDNSIYNRRPNNQSELLHKNRDVFIGLSPEDKCILLSQVSWIFKAQDANPCDLSLVKGSKNAGKIGLTKNIDKFDEVIMITQSVTGVFTKKIDLLEINSI